MGKAVEFYTNYIEYFFERYKNKTQPQSIINNLFFLLTKRSASDSLSILGHFIKKGNTTVFEWRTDIEPSQIERPKETQFDFGNESNNTISQTLKEVSF